MPQINFSVGIPNDTYNVMRDHIAKLGISRNKFIRSLVEEFFAKQASVNQ